MNICTRCKEEKQHSEFSIIKGKLRTTCKACRAECIKRTRKKQPDISVLLTKKKNNQKFIRRVKVLKGCYICGIKFSECLDLHHINMDEKDAEPSAMAGKSREFIKNELRKCVVLCSNHHRMVHAGRIVL